MCKILVIIVSYNGMEWLDKCISSVDNSSVKADIMIIDNGSSDGTIDYITNNYPQVHLIESKQNIGFGKANNIGLKFVLDNNYEYAYLLNQDAWIEYKTLEKLIYVHKSNPEYGIISPIQCNNSKKMDNNFNSACPRSLVSDAILNIKLLDIYETDFVMAAHWLVSRECIKTVGGFSPSFPHYGEDNNYIHRALYHGFKIGICTLTKVIHDRDNRIDTISKMKYMNYISALIHFNNPFISNRKLRLIKDIIIGIINKNGMGYHHAIKLIIEYFTLNNNYKLSLKPGKTFLTI